MALPLTRSPEGDHSFLNAPVHIDLGTLETDVAVIGIPYGAPYGMAGVAGHSTTAPAAIREQSTRFGYGGFIDHWDYDLGGPLLDGRDVRIVDCGDVPGDPLDIEGNSRRATEAVQAILERGAVPIVLGGDDSIPIPVFRAYEGRGPVTIVQIDAHIDWRHDVEGVTEGYSSPMRRASEMEWIGGIVQVGMRGVGSAREQEVRDAAGYGARVIRAREVHEHGVEDAVLGRIPDGGDYFITIDCDGLDPSIMPAVGAPVPGGLTFNQVIDIVHGVAGRGRVSGMNLVELTPHRDLNGITALTACRIILNLIGMLVRAGQVGT